MADRGEMADRPLRTPVPSRSRKRWAVAGGIAGLWLFLLAGTHSIVGGTAVLLLIAAFGIVVTVSLRWLGFDRHHPWVQRAATRPWRDGRDVLQLALRHLSEVFVVTPSGSLLAPNLVELRMNPADVMSLTEMMELEVINSSASELYENKVAAHAARLASPGPVEVSIVTDPDVPAGRYRLKQGRRAMAAWAPGQALAPPTAAPQAMAPPAAAQAMGQRLLVFPVSAASEIEPAFASLVRQGANAVLVADDPFFSTRRDEIVAQAASRAMPTIYYTREFAAAGGLINYGSNPIANYIQAAAYVARILKGTAPADLPVQQPTKFELVINLKTAKMLGLIVPLTLQAAADEVIE